MKVLIAGATGAVGSRLVPRLVAAGHRVAALTRSPAKAEALRQAGVEGRVVDAFDKGSRQIGRPRRATRGRRARDDRAYECERPRSFRSRLCDDQPIANRGAGPSHRGGRGKRRRRFVAQSFCGWPYARRGGPVKGEDDPLDPEPPRELRRTLDAIRTLESSVAGSRKLEGVVLRYGAFYGPRSGLFDGPFLAQLRARRVPMIGDGGGWWSFVHLDDAASATALAIETGDPGIYNIVDDEPAPVREWLPSLAAMLGAKPPRRIPAWVARIAVGEHLVAMMTESRAGSNAKARQALGWRPAYASWRKGFADVIASGG